MIETNLGNNIRFFRKEKGWTQKDLATKLGCSQAVIASYEKETRTPLADKIIVMAQLFNVSFNELFGVQNNIKIKQPKNSKLWKKFEEIDKLPPHEKTVLIKMIDGLLAQKK